METKETIQPPEGLTADQAAAFLEKNAEYYLWKWKTPNSKGWNWCAGLFPLEWLAYRKMYTEAICLFLAMLVFTFTTSYLFDWDLDNLPRLIVIVIMGITGNSLYYKKALRTLQKTTQMEEDERLQFLAKKGGTSTPALIVVLLLETALIVYYLSILSRLSRAGYYLY